MLFIMLVGLVFGVSVAILSDQLYRESLSGRVATVAAALDGEQAAVLNKPSGKDIESEYAYIRDKLANIKLANNDVRFVYLMAKDRLGVYYLADSEPKDSPDYSPHGQRYPEASNELLNIFSNKQVVVEGPIGDRWGTRVSALAPITDISTGKTAAVVGIDIPARSYYELIALSGIGPLLLAAAVSGVIIVSDRIRRRRLDILRFRSELVSIASHELRTPLTGIRWSEESMLKEKLNKAQKEDLETLYDSTIRLQESIEDILQLANLQGTRSQELKLTETDVSDIFKGIFATQKLPAAQNHITLEFAPDWPMPLMINCDAQRMKRVFNNIISNAIKYTRPNTSVTVAHHKVDGAHVISIADKGIGIPEAEQSKVFSGFYRASNAVKQETNGTGMGLYLSQTTVEQHGGKIWLKSEENKGTIVYIQLPS